jgi:hypothetical protein
MKIVEIVGANEVRDVHLQEWIEELNIKLNL